MVVANNINNNNNTMATAAATTTTTTPLATQSEGQHTAEERSGDNSRNSGDNIRNSGDNSRNTGDNSRNSGDNSRNTRPSLMVGWIGLLRCVSMFVYPCSIFLCVRFLCACLCAYYTTIDMPVCMLPYVCLALCSFVCCFVCMCVCL